MAIINVNLPLQIFEEGGVDTSQDTVTADKMLMGYTAHDASGEQITGIIPTYDGSIEQGAVEGAQIKYDEGFEAGKKSEYDAFWDAFQNYGNRREYQYAFAGVGFRNSFYPKYDIIVTRAEYMFASSDEFDVAERLEQLGITLDTSACTAFSNFTRYSSPNHFPTIDTRSASTLSNFAVNSPVVTYDKIILREDGSQNVNNMFYMCTSIANLTIEGVIGQNGFNVQWSTKLTHDSLMSITNALEDKTSDTSGTEWVVTLGSENKAKLTEDEILIAENKGWRVA